MLALWGSLLWSIAVSPANAQDSGRSPGTPSATEQVTEQEASSSRLDRILTRFFGSKTPSGQVLQGRAVSTVERFAGDSGKFIQVVLVHPVARFTKGWDRDRDTTQRILNNLTRPLQSYTDDWVIRDFLLFDRGQTVDPYLLADSERLLRNLSFISDVRINVVPLNDAGDTVAVVVQTTDRWPLGADAHIKNADEFQASVYSVNILGTGLQLRNDFLYRKLGDPDAGYRGFLRNENLAGTFLNAEIEYEDTHLERQERISVERSLVHPGINFVGGISRDHSRILRDDWPTNEVVLLDGWSGLVHRLYDRRQAGVGSRPLIVPAVRFVNRDYRDRPVVTADTNRTYHESRLYLAGLSYRRVNYYQTSYLLGLGETENVPHGVALKITGGYQDGEFLKRGCLFVDTGAIILRDRGDVYFGGVDWGGFFRNDRIEEGILRLDGGYYTALQGSGPYRTRLSGRMEYTLGIRRAEGEFLTLRPAEGLRVLPDRQVQGAQRLSTALEADLFTPWSLMGFRVSCFTYADAGVVGPEKSSSVFQEKIYYGTGLGINVRNPDLALPTWRISLSLQNRIEDSGTEFEIRFRSVTFASLGLPGTKPALLVYR